MRKFFKLAASTAVLSLLTVSALPISAEAATASQREYKRGYNDCSKGRYDQNQHGASYKKGCRAAESKMRKKKKSVAECPADVSEADRYLYPACN